jgi:hypothetical protein
MERGIRVAERITQEKNLVLGVSMAKALPPDLRPVHKHPYHFVIRTSRKAG